MKDRQYIFNEVLAERERQDAQYGAENKNNSLSDWGCIIGEEMGEVLMDINDFKKNGYNPENLRLELIQLIAASVALIEQLDAKNPAIFK
jgi:NTP pyrophosphatase (non-canonical NTP hydrolase)